MTAHRDDIVHYIDQLLQVDTFRDYCHNGIQVEGKETIDTIITGVSAHEELFLKAIEKKADLIIVHHGLFWKSDPHPFYLTSILKNRVKVLLSHDISLLGYHLPLDAHREIGNNACMCDILELNIIDSLDVGFIAEPLSEMTFTHFQDLVKTEIHPSPVSFNFGPDILKRIGVVSGAPDSDLILEAAKHNVDTILCGNTSEQHVAMLRELRINHVNAGHYNTEKFGIRKLGEMVMKEFDILHEFIDVPNPI